MAFILPVVIDDTQEPDALVPDKFRAVQWTRLRLVGFAGQARLPGELPPEVLQRFLKLWSHRTGVLRQEAVTPTAVPASTAAPGRSAMGQWAFAAVAMVLLGAGAWFWNSRSSSIPNSETKNRNAATSTTPPSEAAQLAARAKAIYVEKLYTRTELAVAEDLARRATELERNSATAWGVLAGVHATYVQRGWDLSLKRREDTQSAADRALVLNPDEPEALLARGRILVQGAPAEAEAVWRRALQLDPTNNRTRRALGIRLVNSARQDEGRAMLLEALRLDPADFLARYDLASTYAGVGTLRPTQADYDEALRQLDAGLAVRPFGSGLVIRAVLLAGRGNLGGMRETLNQLEKLPLSERDEDRAVYVAMWGALLERDPAGVIRAAALTSRNYFEDNAVLRPKDWGIALAHRLAGRDGQARLAWQSAETVLRDRLKESPNNPTYGLELAITLAWLDQTEEAKRLGEPIVAAMRETDTERSGRLPNYYYAALGDAPRTVEYLRQTLNSYRFITVPTLRLDPWWDKVRGQPEFEALVQEMAGKF